MKSVGQSKKKLCCGTNMFPNAKIPKWQNQCNVSVFGGKLRDGSTKGHTPQPKFQYMINVHAMMFLVARQGPTVGKCPLKS